ncbi:MAG TPA: hypothetical protein VF218_14935 [Acidothermaceae bacterium]|jgi:hypothetical protein
MGGAGDSRAGKPDRVIVLPDLERHETLRAEFGDRLPAEAIERVIAAARHALERSRQPVTQDAVDRLAREHLRARVARLVSRHNP